MSSLARDAEGAFTFCSPLCVRIQARAILFNPFGAPRPALPLLCAAIQSLDIGQRVRLSNGHVGTIRHVGAGHWAPGDFVGVELGAFTSWR